MGRVLVTFDVDGTLVRSVGADANQLHKAAFRHAHVVVFGPVADVRCVSPGSLAASC